MGRNLLMTGGHGSHHVDLCRARPQGPNIVSREQMGGL